MRARVLSPVLGVVLGTFGDASAQVVLYTFTGTVGEGDFGWSVGAAGDVNADGVPDVIVGAPAWTNPPRGPGEARVFSGADGALLHAFTGWANYTWFGNSVAGLGDVDGDGFSDLAVGAPGGVGAVRVFSGATGSTLHHFVGVPNERLGHSVAAAGDVDGDGTPDRIAGAYVFAIAGMPYGRARVFSGATGATIHDFVGTVPNHWFGMGVAGAGDVDADGHGDLLVGAPSPNFVTGQGGRALVFSGATGAPIREFSGFAGQWDYFGIAVAGGGDCDGDGVPDFVIGAPGTPNGGWIVVFSGGKDAMLLSLFGSDPYDGFGESVAFLGDANGDGRDDLLVGLPGAECCGPGSLNEGQVRVYSGADGSILFTHASTYWFDQHGFSVAGAGDLDGDGRPEAIVGAPGPNGFGAPGRARALSFRPSAVPSR